MYIDWTVHCPELVKLYLNVPRRGKNPGVSTSELVDIKSGSLLATSSDNISQRHPLATRHFFASLLASAASSLYIRRSGTIKTGRIDQWQAGAATGATAAHTGHAWGSFPSATQSLFTTRPPLPGTRSGLVAHGSLWHSCALWKKKAVKYAWRAIHVQSATWRVVPSRRAEERNKGCRARCTRQHLLSALHCN